MRSWIIAMCVTGQLVVLAAMVYGRETVIHGGTQVRIATAPIDPRDPFRGDFVRLRYALNTLQNAPTRWQPAAYLPRKGDRVFAILETRPGGLHDVSYFSNKAPEQDTGSLYLAGRIRKHSQDFQANQVNASFGIEQLFVEQDSGLDIEARRGIRGGLQNAMHAHIAIGKDGTAVLTGYSWSPLAVKLELTDAFVMDQTSDSNSTGTTGLETTGTTALPSLILTVTNVSEQKIILNNPGDDCGFRLESAEHQSLEFFEPQGICIPQQQKPMILAPQESHLIAIDLALPRWHMSRSVGGVIETSDIRTVGERNDWFRLAYRSDRQTETLQDNQAYWQGDLLSQAFSVRGQID